MKLIIDIPDEVYSDINSLAKFPTYITPILRDIIKDGAPYEERPQGDLISREALKKYARTVFDKDLGRLRVVDVSDIDNAPTVDTTCPHCDSGYAQGYSDGYLRAKEDVIHSIAKQYSKHNELVPIWLSIGDIKDGAE